jgi:molybdate transport system permease protein
MTPARSAVPRTLWIPAALGVAFVLAPLAGLAARAPWSDLPRTLGAPSARTALRLSVVVATASSLLVLLAGTPLAWVLARASFKGKRAVRALVVLPLVLPPVVGGVGLLAAFGRRSPLGRLLAAGGISLPFTTAGAVLAAAFVSMPLLVLTVESGLRSVDLRLEQAASAMGASRWYVLRRVTLPLLAPQLAAGLALAWARALGEFGATITFAGNIGGRTQTLPLAVFETLQTNPAAAIGLSLALVGLSLAVMVALRGRILDR